METKVEEIKEERRDLILMYQFRWDLYGNVCLRIESMPCSDNCFRNYFMSVEVAGKKWKVGNPVQAKSVPDEMMKDYSLLVRQVGNRDGSLNLGLSSLALEGKVLRL